MNNNLPIKHICFDLDGTIIDSYNTIYKTTVKALEILKINKSLPEDEFYKRIGHHFIDIFSEMDIPVNDFDEFIEIYKKHYFEFIYESKIYPGVINTLEFLKKNNISVSLLTTKSQVQADNIIDHFNLRKNFTYVMGRRDGIANKPSGEPLQLICNEIKVDPHNTLMVGDTELDIRCGKNAKAKTCAALYGYRTKEAMEAENPNYLINDIKELQNIVKENIF